MDDYRALIRHQAVRTERLRADALVHRLIHDGPGSAPRGAKAAIARLLRTLAERIDPTPRAARPRSI